MYALLQGRSAAHDKKIVLSGIVSIRVQLKIHTQGRKPIQCIFVNLFRLK